MRKIWVIFLFFLSACQMAMPLIMPSDFEVSENLTGKKSRPIAFDSAMIEIKRGTDYVAYPYWRWSFDYVNLGLLDACNVYLKNRFGASVSQWAAGATDFGDWESETAGFIEEALIEAGYDVVSARTSHFHKEREKLRSELLLSAHITSIQSNICNVFNLFYFKDADLMAGNATITVDWEVFDKLQDRVVGTFTTQGFGVVEKPTQNGNTFLLLKALEDAAAHLAHLKDFQNLVLGKVNVQDLIQREKDQRPIFMKRYQPKNFTSLYEKAYLQKRAVVVVGDSEGTGFFISPEGYILTSLKNIGTAKQVALTDEQGTRFVAPVIRTNDRLGVALLKADIMRHTALPVAEEKIFKELSEVFTIGNPSDFYAKNTLSRGTITQIHTKSRKEIPVLQVDIPTTLGYAGAPLLDEYGRVLGIHEGRNKGETNFSYYIPIWEVLRALNIKYKNS